MGAQLLQGRSGSRGGRSANDVREGPFGKRAVRRALVLQDLAVWRDSPDRDGTPAPRWTRTAVRLGVARCFRGPGIESAKRPREDRLEAATTGVKDHELPRGPSLSASR